MNTNRSMAWLREAVGGIKYPPDRRRVEKELYAHVMQRNRDFLKEGCTEREADEKACAVMGDPVEVRRDLAAIHRPFWGYAYLFLRILVIGIFIWALIAFLAHSRSSGVLSSLFPKENPERYSVSRVIAQSEKARCGDYTFHLTRAAYGKSEETEEPCLLMELRASTLAPLLGTPFFPFEPVTLTDSRGETYTVRYRGQWSLVFNSVFYLVAPGMEEGADWAVLTLPGPDGPVWLTLKLGEGKA